MNFFLCCLFRSELESLFRYIPMRMTDDDENVSERIKYMNKLEVCDTTQ